MFRPVDWTGVREKSVLLATHMILFMTFLPLFVSAEAVSAYLKTRSHETKNEAKATDATSTKIHSLTNL